MYNSLGKRFSLWTLLLVLSAVWQQQCGFSDWDLRASTLSCLLLKSATRSSSSGSFLASTSSISSSSSSLGRERGKEDKTIVNHNNYNVTDECNIISAYCISPSQIQLLGPRIISDILALGGPAWIWLPLLWVFYTGIRKNNNNTITTSTVPSTTTVVPSGSSIITSRNSSSLSASVSLVSTTQPNETVRILSTIFTVLRIVLIYTMYMYLVFIMIIRFTVKLVDYFGGWDPSGHVFLYGLQLIPLWLLPTVTKYSNSSTSSGSSITSNFNNNSSAYKNSAKEGTTGTPSLSSSSSLLEHIYYHPSSSYNLSRPLVNGMGISLHHILSILEIIIYYMTFTTASFFHTPSETFASWLIITIFVIILRYIVESTLYEVQKLKDGSSSLSVQSNHSRHSSVVPLLTPSVQRLDQCFLLVLLWYIFTVGLCYVYVVQPSHNVSLSRLASVSPTSYVMFGSYVGYDTFVIVTLYWLRKQGKTCLDSIR